MTISFGGMFNSFFRYVSAPNPKILSSQLFFDRGVASKLFVKGISFSTTEETLAKAFSQFGEVVEAKIIVDKFKNRPKGFAYVTFTKVEEAEKALEEMNGKLLDGRVVFVANARPPRHFRESIPIARGPPKPAMECEYEDGFLKLTKTQEWVLGDNTAPVNKKIVAKVHQDDSEKRKRLNLLKYEALKREMLLLSIGIGTACSGYCLVVLSTQAAISYAAGVLFSCLYLQLLYRHVDNLSKEAVPQIFMKKKSKKIGIRSKDLEDLLERTIKGSSIALSSPRLVIPAAIYGLWILSQHFAVDIFDFQLVPAMFGMFAYKAAALVQVYRDNKDLLLVFPDDEESRND